MCFFKKATDVFFTKENADYNTELIRLVWPGEPIVYVKKFRGEDGKSWCHLVELYGTTLVHSGSIKELTKKHIKYQETFEKVG